MRRFEIAPFANKGLLSLFDDFDREFADLRGFEKDFLPKVDMGEKDGHFWASFDVPGIKKEDIHLEVNDDVISISGERSEENKGEKYSEKRYGSFSRSFRVPKGYDLKNLEANHENGVLSIVVPLSKDEDKKAQKVEIQSGSGGLFSKLFN
ncbi:Hsp20/alpha crystallin family protein [Bacteriovorax sp. DB6_IX]|uniref:Hsp20/alpha crystallin family protein n=1 Tax=Bacteriovorax sp. DB6_IX TaxID=1353530 RepID=UPI00038A089D|nr:Hsp20/alpha crystallin family protein [Bacteriovorax sp. DB6_IX]EQC52213.1 Hsp20/alpha crystallin family protein [Bacteriovorax sp. DB6_IX]